MIIDHLKLALGEIFANKVEVTLTGLGLIVGIAAVMIILTLGQGAEIIIKRNFSLYKPYVLRVDYAPTEHAIDPDDEGGESIKHNIDDPFGTAGDYGSFGEASQSFDNLVAENAGKSNRIQVEESQRPFPMHLASFQQDWIKNPYVVDVAIQAQGVVSANVHDKEVKIQVWFSSANLGQFLKQDLAYGRWFSDLEVDDERPVAILQLPLSDFAAYVIDGGVVGQQVRIGSRVFTVVGAIAGDESALYIPFTFYPALNDSNSTTHFLIKLPDSAQLNAVYTGAMKWMKKFGYNGEYVEANDATSQILKLLQYLPQFTFLMSFIAGISLFVGGLGVMNTVLSSVIKRTKEIGIRKAIGAPKWSIILQFMMETVLISMGGGIIGVGVGFAVSIFILRIFQVPIFIPFAAMFICVFVTLVIGILSGVVPAVKAASLDPIDAIGHS